MMAQHRELKGMSAQMLRALWHARVKVDARFRRDPANRATFLALLQQPHGMMHELRRMNDLSVLGRYLPVFRRIVGQMQHDLFHVYTVDQHILMVLRNLRRFTMPEHAHEYPLCSQLMADFDRPWVLYIAALFHDIAKGRGGDHSELGSREARRFCREHGLDRADTALVEFLVAQHLTLSQVAQKQDLADPDGDRALRRAGRDERTLTALYLLTVADIRGTSPKVWNAWKGKLLEDLYRSTRRLLGGGTVAPDRGPRRRASRRRCACCGCMGCRTTRARRCGSSWTSATSCATARRTSPGTRARCSAGSTASEPVVRARLARVGEGLQVLVYVKDQKDLFARICGYFDSRNFSILDARSTRRATAMRSTPSS